MKVQCANHPGMPATATCAACGRMICNHCKVQMGWNTVCVHCNDRVAQGMQGGGQFGTSRNALAPKKTCEEATHALIFAIVGIFCCGFILGIVAIMKANQAKTRIRRQGLAGEGMATAAFVIGIIDIVLGSIWLLIWIISMVAGIAGS